MTYIMHHTYGYNNSGRYNFFTNRLLRIFPSYWFAICITLVILLIYGDSVTSFKNTLFIPQTIKEWLQNAALIFTSSTKPRLSPPTWALTVELFYYIMICLGISRTREMSLIWLIQSILYTIYLLFNSTQDWAIRYYPIPAASLPFAIGACIFHNWEKFDQIKLLKAKYIPTLLTLAIVGNFLISFIIEYKIFPNYLMTFGFYTNLSLMTICIISLIQQKTKKSWKRLDIFIGKFSYPLYLIHWQAGALVFLISGKAYTIGYLSFDGLAFLTLSLIVSFSLSFIMIISIDDPIEKLRKIIKSKQIL